MSSQETLSPRGRLPNTPSYQTTQETLSEDSEIQIQPEHPYALRLNTENDDTCFGNQRSNLALPFDTVASIKVYPSTVGDSSASEESPNVLGYTSLLDRHEEVEDEEEHYTYLDENFDKDKPKDVDSVVENEEDDNDDINSTEMFVNEYGERNDKTFLTKAYVEMKSLPSNTDIMPMEVFDSEVVPWQIVGEESSLSRSSDSIGLPKASNTDSSKTDYVTGCNINQHFDRGSLNSYIEVSTENINLKSRNLEISSASQTHSLSDYVTSCNINQNEDTLSSYPLGCAKSIGTETENAKIPSANQVPISSDYVSSCNVNQTSDPLKSYSSVCAKGIVPEPENLEIPPASLNNSLSDYVSVKQHDDSVNLYSEVGVRKSIKESDNVEVTSETHTHNLSDYVSSIDISQKDSILNSFSLVSSESCELKTDDADISFNAQTTNNAQNTDRNGETNNMGPGNLEKYPECQNIGYNTDTGVQEYRSITSFDAAANSIDQNLEHSCTVSISSQHDAGFHDDNQHSEHCINPVELRMTKSLSSFGHSECKRGIHVAPISVCNSNVTSTVQVRGVKDTDNSPYLEHNSIQILTKVAKDTKCIDQESSDNNEPKGHESSDNSEAHQHGSSDSSEAKHDSSNSFGVKEHSHRDSSKANQHSSSDSSEAKHESSDSIQILTKMVKDTKGVDQESSDNNGPKGHKSSDNSEAHQHGSSEYSEAKHEWSDSFGAKEHNPRDSSKANQHSSSDSSETKHESSDSFGAKEHNPKNSSKASSETKEQEPNNCSQPYVMFYTELRHITASNTSVKPIIILQTEGEQIKSASDGDMIGSYSKAISPVGCGDNQTGSEEDTGSYCKAILPVGCGDNQTGSEEDTGSYCKAILPVGFGDNQTGSEEDTGSYCKAISPVGCGDYQTGCEEDTGSYCKAILPVGCGDNQTGSEEDTGSYCKAISPVGCGDNQTGSEEDTGSYCKAILPVECGGTKSYSE